MFQPPAFSLLPCQASWTEMKRWYEEIASGVLSLVIDPKSNPWGIPRNVLDDSEGYLETKCTVKFKEKNEDKI